MEMGPGVVPPMAAGQRMSKLLVPWRFRPGPLTEPVKHIAAATPVSGGGAGGLAGAVPKAKVSGSGAAQGGGGEPQSKRFTRSQSAESLGADGCGRPGAGNSGVTRDCNGAGVGVAPGEDNTWRSKSSASGRDTDGQGIRRTSRRNVGVEKRVPKDLNNSRVNGARSKSNGSGGRNCMAKGSSATAKGCSSAGPGSSGNETYSKKGEGLKAFVPGRFHVGCKRSPSEAFGSGGGSMKSPRTRFCMTEDSSALCTPVTRSTVQCYASTHSSVRVSAMRDFSTVTGVESGIEYEDRKPVKDGKGSTKAIGNTVRNLQNFRLIWQKLREEELNWRRGADLRAYKIFRERFSTECDDKKYLGSVPGVNIGDIFHMRVELSIVGLNGTPRGQGGVDYFKNDDGTYVAISIVSSAQSSDVKNLDVLVYSGPETVTGSTKIDGVPNLALKKSMDTKTPVRVIHRFTIKKNPIYTYGGLYLVKKYWREKKREGYVYMFQLRRMDGQKHIDIEEILRRSKAELNCHIIMSDISQGLERIPISVVNSISDEYPMPFVYISRLRYPSNYQPAHPAGCGCVGGCSDSKKCACAVKNGGTIPFNDKGCLLKAKPLVYECGPSCKCPPTCHNRVGQHGIKFQLQVFKTKSMGWGVSTLDFIPSGSFVCEFIGEILEDEEAQKRKNDEYLFAIGHNYYDGAHWKRQSRSIPALQKGPGNCNEAGFVVDASEMGNFTKFINHSCTPNLYAQNVLYDHDDIAMPHVMFFAIKDIQPHEELAYDYNYKIDQVHDASGNIKKKKCLCGSVECTGRLY